MQEDKLVKVKVEHLRKKIEEGKSMDEMVEELKLPNRLALEQVLQMMHRSGMEVPAPGLIGKASIHPRYTRGGTRVDPQMLEGTGQEEAVGDYNVTIDQGVISISKGNVKSP